MPLPDASVPWPPRDFEPYRNKVAIWDAWWTGDPELLAAAYGGSPGTPQAAFSPLQYAGGVGGRLARFWWGRPPSQGEPQAKAHVPLASDIARASADLLFSEPLEATADAQATTDYLDVVLGDGMQAKLLEAAEIAAGLGGVYLRPAYNQLVANAAWIEAISPDHVIPEWISGHLRAGTLWRVLERTSDRTVVRHLERHEPGWTVHGLYVGSDSELGRPVPLTEHEETAHLADFVNADGAVETGYPGLALRYVPNMRPSKPFRRDPLLAPLGQSDLADIEGLLDQLDEVHSSWMRDIRLAKGRIIVPENYLEVLGPGKGARFDPDREAYSALPGFLDANPGEHNMITVQQFAIRVGEHEATERNIITQALRTAGYSAQTFGDGVDATTMATATEVVARERRSFITRNRKIQYWRPELVALLEAYLAIDAYAYGRPPLDPTGLAVEFADSVSEDQITVAQTVQTLRAAGAMSVETAIREVHPDWTDVQVAEERERILDDERRVAPADLARTIGNLGDDDEDPDDEPDGPPDVEDERSGS
ncbi:phage portal protein [Actinomycetospora aeridis]|uniref:Phage portal protein n=1 Tax=Actinomycetospora aeridis TaxID=3129231 RepID=A0ABU8N1B2_9PSEU